MALLIDANPVILGGLFPNGMWVCGYLCLIVKETARDYEHGSIFTSLYPDKNIQIFNGPVFKWLEL